jgi:YHS domain-containing protein
MKNVLAIIATLAIVGGVTAQNKPKPKPKPQTPKEIACPVMPTQKVNIAKATKEKMFADYKGRRYFFCCAGCPPAFKANPAKFAKGPSIPTPKKS